MDEERSRIEDTFPGLKRCEWSIIGELNEDYNCIAWSVGETNEWYNPSEIDELYGDNDGIFEVSDMDAFYYAKKGWRPIASGPEDAEAVYYPYAGSWNYLKDPYPAVGYHGAKKCKCNCGSGKWVMFESKCGGTEKIEHVWNQLDGSSYGSASRFYK